METGVEGKRHEGAPAEPPVVNILGEKVALGPHRRDLLPTYQRWINDFGTLRTLGMPPRPMTLEQEQAWYESTGQDQHSIGFTIYVREGWQPIGTAGLHAINYRHQSAEFGILIGEAAERGKGYGTETARLMLDYAFTALGLHSVSLLTDEFNLAGQRAYEKAGFRVCGRQRQCRLVGGKWWDTIRMDCLAGEFISPVLERVFAPDVPREPQPRAP